MQTIINLNFQIKTDLFSLHLEEGEREGFYLRSKPGEAIIICPPNVDFDKEHTQKWFKQIVKNILRNQAKAILPHRLAEHASQHNLLFNKVFIKDVRTRWGSCSSLKNINLSLYLILLPSKFIDYVLLHELCHTVEMNHGPHFWALLDQMIGKNSKKIRKEMRAYADTLTFSF